MNRDAKTYYVDVDGTLLCGSINTWFVNERARGDLSFGDLYICFDRDRRSTRRSWMATGSICYNATGKNIIIDFYQSQDSGVPAIFTETRKRYGEGSLVQRIRGQNQRRHWQLRYYIGDEDNLYLPLLRDLATHCRIKKREAELALKIVRAPRNERAELGELLSQFKKRMDLQFDLSDYDDRELTGLFEAEGCVRFQSSA
jgi:hypothetical protein